MNLTPKQPKMDTLEYSIWSNDEYLESQTSRFNYDIDLLGLRDNEMLPQDEYPYEVLGLSAHGEDYNFTEE